MNLQIPVELLRTLSSKRPRLKSSERCKILQTNDQRMRASYRADRIMSSTAMHNVSEWIIMSSNVLVTPSWSQLLVTPSEQRMASVLPGSSSLAPEWALTIPGKTLHEMCFLCFLCFSVLCQFCHLSSFFLFLNNLFFLQSENQSSGTTTCTCQPKPRLQRSSCDLNSLNMMPFQSVSDALSAF